MPVARVTGMNLPSTVHTSYEIKTKYMMKDLNGSHTPTNQLAYYAYVRGKYRFVILP